MVWNRRRGERRISTRRQTERATADRRQVDRRHLLKLGAFVTFTSLFRHPLVARASKMLLPSREISLFNTHTGEKLVVEYCTEGEYTCEALQEINHILRDFRTGEIKPIDPHLLNLLHAITHKIKPGSEIHIISGYRSPATNRALAKKSGAVAKHSLHIDGKAIDFRIPGCELTTLRQVALTMQSGGVGYYAQSNFVHIDTGRVRCW
ncbi:MAG: DUF882 domain-containing protein [Proteobacteria bacterium]|nr:DUF882 domain-containing protein [Pseudomonadota bacterium]MBU1639158.1 DUF882 domain-containing protein [Pseudomonadota bacterium]